MAIDLALEEREAADTTSEALLDASPSAEPAARVLRRFRVVFNAVKTHFRLMEKEAGVGGAQVWALSLIRDHPGIGIGDLARRMDIHQSTASNLVKALLELKMVVADKSAQDRRAVQLSLLPAGVEVLRRAPGPFSGVLPMALRSLDEGTLLRMDKDLAALIELLDADERASGVPLSRH